MGNLAENLNLGNRVRPPPPGRISRINNRKTDQYRKRNKLRSENHKTKDVFVCMNRPKC